MRRLKSVITLLQVLLFDGDEHNPDQEKVLALSRMFDNILREVCSLQTLPSL